MAKDVFAVALCHTQRASHCADHEGEQPHMTSAADNLDAWTPEAQAAHNRLIAAGLDIAGLVALLRAAEVSDLVVASRYVQGVSVRNWPLRRVLLSAMANRYARLVTSLPCSDLTSGFCLYRAEILRDAVAGNLFTSGYAFLIEMKYRAWRAGARLHEVPYTFVERRLGTSKMSGRRLLEGIVAPILCRAFLGRPDADVRSRPTGRDEV